MAEFNKHKIQQWGTVLIIGLFSIFLLYLNTLSPLMPGDDYLYSLKIPSDHYLGDAPIQSIGDYIESQINHFNNYNYRVLPHAVLQFILLLPHWVFDVFNTLVFLALPIAILKRFNVRNRLHLAWYLFVLLFLWIFHFDLGRSYFWTTGSLNYSWTLIPQLLFVHTLLRYVDHTQSSQGNTIWILAIIIAMTNEQVVLSLFIVASWILLFRYKQNRKLDIPLLCGTLILLAGGLIMYFSPAMSFRLGREGFRYESDYHRWIEYFRRVIYYALRYSPILLLLLLHRHQGFKLKTRTKYLLAIALISMASMSQAPLFEPRSAIFGFVVLLIAAIDYVRNENPHKILLALLIGVSTFLYIERIPLFQDIANRHFENTQVLNTERGNQDTVYLDRYCSSYKYQCLICDDITDDPEYMDNEPVAAFYNIGKLALKPEVSLLYQSLEVLQDFEEGQVEGYRKAKHNRKDLTDEVSLNECYYSKSQSLNLAIELNTTLDLTDHIVILRGSRAGINRYRMYDWIPLHWRLYFLDFLEYNASIKEVKGKKLAVHTVFDPDKYEYYLISLYNLNNHAPIGNPIRIEIPNDSNGR